MAHSMTSTSDTSITHEWLGNAPVVACSVGLADFIELAKPASSTMVLPMMPPTQPLSRAEAVANAAATSMFSYFTNSSSCSGKQSSYDYSQKDLTTITGITTTTISTGPSSIISSASNHL